MRAIYMRVQSPSCAPPHPPPSPLLSSGPSLPGAAPAKELRISTLL